MNDKNKTKAQLISELAKLRGRVAQAEGAGQSQIDHGPFRTLVETTASALFIWQDSVFRYTNPAFSKLTGYTADEIRGTCVWDLMHPDYREPIGERVLAWQRGEPVPPRSEFKILMKSGETRWIDADSTFIEYDGRPAALTIAYDSTGYKLAEESLNESEQRYSKIIETAQEAIWIVDPAANSTYVNQRLADMLGYTRDELLGRSVFDFIDDADRTEMRQYLERGRSGVKEQRDFRFQRKDGSEVWTMASTTPLFDGAGSFKGGLAMLIDISERRRSEEALRKSEARWRAYIKQASDLIFTVDRSGRIVSVNDATCEATGYCVEEILGKTLIEFVIPEHRATAVAGMRNRIAGVPLEQMELEILAKDGRRVSLEIRGTVQYDGDQPSGTFEIARDITERKLAEKALRESEVQLQAVLDNCPAMIFEKDIEGNYLRVNQQFERIFSLTSEQVLGRGDDELFPPEVASVFRATDRKVLEAGHPLEFEESTVHSDGIHTYMIHKFPLLDSAGNVYAVGGISTDITARKRAEDDLRKQKEILEKIFDHIPVMIRFLDENGRVKLVSAEWERTLGWALKDIERQDLDIFAELYPDLEYRQYVLGLVAASTGEFTDLRTTIRSGKVIDTSFANIRLEDGTNIGIGRDISDRKRAAELLRRQSARLAALREIGLEISAESDLSRILEVVTQRAAELLSCDRCGVYILDQDGTGLELVATLDRELTGLRLREGVGLTGRVAVRGHAQAIDDYELWEGRRPELDDKGLGPALSAPLKWQQTVIGAISLARGQGEAAFSDDDIHLVEQIAADAAIAIHQASQFEEVEEGRRRLQALSHRFMDVHEAERKHLARELHDQIGQALTAVQISLQSLRNLPGLGANVDRVQESLDVIDDALEQVHDLSLDLRPSTLDDIGLVAALRWYANRITSRAGLKLQFTANDPDTRVAPEVETACFRISQEALTNVLRHANASSIFVEVTHDSAHLRLQLRDDGIGFDVGSALKRTGQNASLGLQGMRERAAALGGVVVIESKPGHGTTVEASFPLTHP